VVVLRCAGTRNAKSASTMNFDGAGDIPDNRFSVEDSSSPSNARSMYDDRGPFFTNFGNSHGQPPPISSYRPPYVESLRSQESPASRSRRPTHNSHELFPQASIAHHSRPHSRYSEPISPGARRAGDLPASGFQYGTGPIPRDAEPYNHHAVNAGAAQPPAVDPTWLNNLLTTAVKQGVEESRRIDTQSEGQAKHGENTLHVKTTSQPPGAWPESPFGPQTLPHQQTEPPAFSSRDHQSDRGSNWAKSQPGWGRQPPRSRAGTHVTWNAEPALETDSSSVGGWNSREETPSDSWDTGDTWPTDKVAEWDASSRQGTLWVTKPPSHYHERPSSPVAPRTRERQRSKHGSKRNARSKSRSRRSRRDKEVTSSSSEDLGSWDRLERPSDSVVSLSSSEGTLQPSQSQSRMQRTRRSSKSRSRRSKSAQHGHERKTSKHSHHTPVWGPENAIPAVGPAPSVITRMTPTVMNAPPSALPTQVQSRQPSAYSVPLASVMPVPEWGAAIDESMRKPSVVPSNTFPAPYAPSLKDFVQSTAGDKLGGNRLPSSSPWGDNKKTGAGELSWDKHTGKDADWGKKSDSGWQEDKPKESDKKGWYSTDDDQVEGWSKADDNVKVQADDDWNLKDCDWGKRPSSPKQEREEKMNEWAGLKSALISAFDNPPAPAMPLQNQSWALPTNTVESAIHQTTTTPFASAPAPPAPAQDNPNPSSQRMSNKTLARYRPNHPSLTVSSQLATLNPHWQFPPPPSTSTLPNTLHPIDPNDAYIAPAEPRLTISQTASSKTGIEHAVRAGKATQYGHVVGRPEYLDRLENPYAVFRFKYRSEGVLRDLGVYRDGGGGEEVKQETDKEKVEKLKRVPQEELIGKVLALERRLESKGGAGAGAGDGAGNGDDDGRRHSRRSAEKDKNKHKERENKGRRSEKVDAVVNDFTEQWVERHSRDQSLRAKSMRVAESGEKDSGEKEGNEVGSWGRNVDHGWGGGDVSW
jgi:hypothetical protein